MVLEMLKKTIRTISGVTPLAVMLKPYPCPHGKCIYCPSQQGVPESYTAKSPVVLRAMECNWDAYKQVEARLKILKLMGHITNKIELIVMGGTFSSYPMQYQEDFIKGCFDGLNGFVASNLEEAHKFNETAWHRCVGLCLETRPDVCKKQDIDNFLRFGATRVEIGVQAPDDNIYKLTNRGHTLADVINATALLKDAAFKIGYHIMLGLPGSTPKKDVSMIKQIFSDERFQPDQIKLYPTFVIKGTPLEEMYKKGEYTPYTTEQIISILAKIKSIIPPHVRIMRIMRDIPAEYIVSQCKYSHLRDELKTYMKKAGINCRCIRCREIGHAEHQGREIDIKAIQLKIKEYMASGGKEVFLSFEDTTNDILLSIARLRFPGSAVFRREIDQDTALIRELHTFGREAKIGTVPSNSWQHKGFGRALMAEAEEIAKKNGYKKMIVISAVGTREYFRKLDYKNDGPYMGKMI